MLTWTAQRALNVTNSATGQGNVLPPGIAHEALIAEPLSPQDIRNKQFSKTTDRLSNMPSLSKRLFET